MKKSDIYPIRLDKLLASSALGSRRETRRILREGKVSLDGSVLSDPARRLTPAEISRLLVNGSPFQARLTPVIMMNKAAGKITAMEDDRLPAAASDLPPEWLNKGLSPIGRLDRDTTGLLLFTTDGNLNHRLCSPRYEIEKQYLISYRGEELGEKESHLAAEGLLLADGTHCLPARLQLGAETDAAGKRQFTDEDGRVRFARLIIREGKFHQVKRMIAQLGRELIRLHRERVAGLWLPDSLASGSCLFLDAESKALLYHAVGLEPPLF